MKHNSILRISIFIFFIPLFHFLKGMQDNEITNYDKFYEKIQKNRNNIAKLEKYSTQLDLLKNSSQEIQLLNELNNQILYLQTNKRLNYLEKMPARYEKNNINALKEVKTALDNIVSTKLKLNQQAQELLAQKVETQEVEKLRQAQEEQTRLKQKQHQELQHINMILIPHVMQLINAERIFSSKKLANIKDLIPSHEEYQNDLESFYSLKRDAFDGGTILQHAIKCKFSLAAINYLLSLGQNINDINNDGENALHTTVVKGNYLVLKLLLSYKPTLYTTEELKKFSAINESKNNLYSCLLQEIYAKPNINMQNIFGQTPLHIACKRKQKKIINLLLDYNASAVIKDNNNKEPVDYLFEQSWTDESTLICKDLLEINEPEKLSIFLENQNILHAIKQGLKPIIYEPIKKQELQKKYKPLIFEGLLKNYKLTESIVKNNYTMLNKLNGKEETLVCWAIAHNNFKFCEWLLKNNASPNCRSNVVLSKNSVVKLTPLEHMTLYPFCVQKILNLLLKYKPNQNLCILNPPLHQLALLNNTQGIKTLLHNNADINMKDFLESTALHDACKKNLSSAILLLFNKANPNLINRDSKAALDYCYENKNDRFILLLLAFGATAFQKKIFVDNVEIKNFSIIKKLIKINKKKIAYNIQNFNFAEENIKVLFDKKGIHISLPKVKFKS